MINYQSKYYRLFNEISKIIQPLEAITKEIRDLPKEQDATFEAMYCTWLREAFHAMEILKQGQIDGEELFMASGENILLQRA